MSSLGLIHKIRNATPGNKITKEDIANALLLLHESSVKNEKRYAYTELGYNDSEIVIDCSADVCVVRASDYDIDWDIKQLVFENLPQNNKTVRVMIDNTNKKSTAHLQININMFSSYKIALNGDITINLLHSANNTIPFKVREYKSNVFIGDSTNSLLYVQPDILYEVIWEDYYYSYFIFQNSQLIEYPTYSPLRVILPPHGHQFSENNIVYKIKAANYFGYAREGDSFLNWTEFYNDLTDGILLDFVFDKENNSQCQIRISQTGLTAQYLM